MAWKDCSCSNDPFEDEQLFRTSIREFAEEDPTQVSVMDRDGGSVRTIGSSLIWV